MHTRPISSEELSAMAAKVRPRKPRLAIMGEFSAGKSTLTNLLLGTSALPVKVTATQLPPVWLSHGAPKLHQIDLTGASHDLPVQGIEAISLEKTAIIRSFLPAPFLEHWDLIDFPGISDPNMSAAVWERIIPLADAVLWCTHATQAWRQSEAAVWEEIGPRLAASSLLLLTRIDNLATQSDRDRVLTRVARETEGLFAANLPISLTEATDSIDEPDGWQSSGAGTLMEQLDDLEKRLILTGHSDFTPSIENKDPRPVQESAPPVSTQVQPRRIKLRKPTAPHP